MYFFKFITYLFHIDCCKENCCNIKCCDKYCFVIDCENNEKKDILSIDEEWKNILKDTEGDIIDTDSDNENDFVNISF